MAGSGNITTASRRRSKDWPLRSIGSGQDPFHPSLAFKRLRGGEDRFSVRVGEHHRAIGQRAEEGIEWVWIGSHEDYNKLIR